MGLLPSRVSPAEFDLVNAGYTMAKLTGLDLAGVAKLIRPNMPILLCTWFSEIAAPDILKELGMELLVKPYDIRQISEVVRKILLAQKGLDFRSK